LGFLDALLLELGELGPEDGVLREYLIEFGVSFGAGVTGPGEVRSSACWYLGWVGHVVSLQLGRVAPPTTAILPCSTFRASEVRLGVAERDLPFRSVAVILGDGQYLVRHRVHPAPRDADGIPVLSAPGAPQGPFYGA